VADWLTVDDIARDLGKAPDTIRAWIRQKKLIAYRLGRDYQIKPEDYRKFLESRRTDADEGKGEES
jgi:excisionase family DNA binding protein